MMTASPGGQGPPRRRGCAGTPPGSRGRRRRWMAPSTPPPPSRPELAALTMASVGSRVMSPRISSMRPRAEGAGGGRRLRWRKASRTKRRRGRERARPLAPSAGSTWRRGRRPWRPWPRRTSGAGGRDLDLLAGLRVAAHARLVVAHDQLPDPGDREAVLGLLVGQRGQGLEVGGGLLLRDLAPSRPARPRSSTWSSALPSSQSSVSRRFRCRVARERDRRKRRAILHALRGRRCQQYFRAGRSTRRAGARLTGSRHDGGLRRGSGTRSRPGARGPAPRARGARSRAGRVRSARISAASRRFSARSSSISRCEARARARAASRAGGCRGRRRASRPPGR